TISKKTRRAERTKLYRITLISPHNYVKRSKSNTWEMAPKIAPPVMTIAISDGLNWNLWSTNKLKNDSNAANPNDAIKMRINAIKYFGSNTRLMPFLLSTVSSV